MAKFFIGAGTEPESARRMFCIVHLESKRTRFFGSPKELVDAVVYLCLSTDYNVDMESLDSGALLGEYGWKPLHQINFEELVESCMLSSEPHFKKEEDKVVYEKKMVNDRKILFQVLDKAIGECSSAKLEFIKKLYSTFIIAGDEKEFHSYPLFHASDFSYHLELVPSDVVKKYDLFSTEAVSVAHNVISRDIGRAIHLFDKKSVLSTRSASPDMDTVINEVHSAAW
jgi:hypothetical protein